MTKTIIPTLAYKLIGLPKRVVQQATINGHYIYALQRQGGNTYIRRSMPLGKTAVFSSGMMLTNTASDDSGFGHTQTWVDIENHQWLVGAKNNKGWSIQLARLPFTSNATYHHNFTLPRLSHLNRATDLLNGYPGGAIKRVEAAVSPDHSKLLITSLQNSATRHYTCHFALYSLAEVNAQLDQSLGKKDTPIDTLTPLAAFHINDFYLNDANLDFQNPSNQNLLNSFQGIALDNDCNLYITSGRPQNELLPNLIPQRIFKIPWGATKAASWRITTLDHPTWSAYGMEIEAPQIVNDQLYVTMAYHKLGKTVKNNIFRVGRLS